MGPRALLRITAFLALASAALAQVLPPTPTVTAVSPNPVTQGNFFLQLTVTGTNFCTGALTTTPDTVYFTPPGGSQSAFPVNAANVASTTQLSIVIPSTELGTPGTAQLSVQCGNSALSAPFNVTINPAPTLTSLTPSGVAAGGPGFNLVITGTNFFPGMQVTWCNNCDTDTLLTPTSITSTQITVPISASLYTLGSVVDVNVLTTDNVTATFSLPLFIGAGPVITGVLPASVLAGSGSFLLTMSGTGFRAGDIIQWNGANLPGTQFPPASSNLPVLTVMIPAALVASPTTAALTVLDPGNLVSAAVPFQVLGPTITSLSQNSAIAGSPAFNLTINGANFSSSATVQWNTTPLTIVSQSGTQIVATVPANLLAIPGNDTITVANPGNVTATAAFSVLAPTITSLSQTSAIAGSPAFNLTINGTNFLSTSTVTLGSTALTVVSSTVTQIVATVPANALATAGVFPVTVTNSPSATASTNFTVNGPTITNLNPASAIAGSPATNVAINGTNFLNTSTVTFGSGTPLTVVSSTATQIVVAVPANLLATAGVFPVKVTNSATATASANFTVGSVSVTTLNPGAAIAGSPATNVAINGTNFLNTSTVTLAGTPLTIVSTTATQIVATIPANLLTTPGVFPVTVANSPTATASANFSVNGPIVTSLVPASAAAGSPAMNVTILGTNFLSTSTVTWGSANTPLNVVSATINQIVAAIPANLLITPGAFAVTVSNSTAATATSSFSVGAPVILSFSQTTIVALSQGFSLTISGNNFVNGSQVKWGTSTLLQVLSQTATSIVVTVPASLLLLPGTNLISVTNPGGATSNAEPFVVIPATLQITTVGLGNITPGTPYSFTLTGIGGVLPYTWAASGLPPGINLDPNTGILSGASGAVGNYNVTVQLTDSRGISTSRVLTLGVSPPPLTISTTALAAGNVGTPYSQPVTASGGNPPYTWSVNQGTLPAGLSLRPNGDTALITGTPTTAGTTQVGLLVTDSSGAASGRLFTLVINPPVLTITTAGLPDVVIGAPYTPPALQATGGTPPYTWALSAGTTTGFSVNPSTGVISLTGSPASGQATLVAQVTDSAGATASKTFTINVSATGLTITTVQVNPGTVGVAYAAVQFAASGGTPPYTWSVSAGSLPAGLALSTGGNLTGTPTSAGNANFTVEVTDSKGQTASKPFPITVTAPLVITTTSVPDGVVGAQYSATLAASGGTAPYTWGASSGLPDGVSLDSGGTFSGTPSRAATFTFSVTVTDSAGRTANKQFTSNVVVGLSITTTSLPDGVVSSAYSAAVAASGGTPPYKFAASGLPDGLSVDADSGQISGTPTAAGTATVQFTATDSANRTSNRSLTIKIGVPPFSGISITGLPDTSSSQQQPKVTITTNAPYPVPISGSLALSFASAVGGDDLMIQFSTGGRTVNFTIPANTTSATFSSPSGVAVLTGTVAGTITLTTTLSAGGQDITPSPAPQRTIVIPKSAPIITAVSVTRNATGFSVDITGFSPTRDMTQATFQFTAASGASLQNATVTVSLNTQFTAWFQNTAVSNPFGSQFTVTIPFTTQGAPTTVTGLSVTLTNSFGVSAPATATF